ncbi:Leucine rich protein [Streptococcus sp. DD10]|uniref:helix-turn-helix domain-containing protein n=1 Tax=Streptococcus sp. DD10 TaxID=1777878 RepID=UPI0007997046|nr:helix-turn-helix domain-containing protein [Streptococcus sp. DD10]KXT74705.1 Leucine rich protein [Streptococcus sp. DD10]
MDLQRLFPQGRWVESRVTGGGTYCFPLESGFWLVDRSSLTEREHALADLIEPTEKSPLYGHPLYDFLELRGPQPNLQVKAVQFVHLHIRQTSLENMGELLDMLQFFFSNYLTHFQANHKDYVLVLDQTRFTEVTEILEDTLSAMEFDFDSQLSFLVGNVLTSKQSGDWPGIFQLERQLFSKWNAQFSRSACLSFSRIYLWWQRREPVFASYLSQLIQNQEGLTDIILAIWQESAVLTKAAQKLYIHRNTLQYRLEKFHEATGLSLKNMDDLALCYLTVMGQAF